MEIGEHERIAHAFEQGVGRDRDEIEEAHAMNGPSEQQPGDDEPQGGVIELGQKTEAEQVGEAGNQRGDGGADDEPGLQAKDAAHGQGMPGQAECPGEQDAVGIDHHHPEQHAPAVVGRDQGVTIQQVHRRPEELVAALGGDEQPEQGCRPPQGVRPATGQSPPVIEVAVGKLGEAQRTAEDAQVGQLGKQDFGFHVGAQQFQ